MENATRNLISTVQNTHDTAEKQCTEDSATRHSTLRQAVSTALSKTLSCTPNREQRTLLDNQDHHDLLDTIARRSCDLAVSAADYTFDAAITVNILTRIHSSSQGLNWQDHQQEAPLAQVNITLTAIQGAIQTAKKTMNAALGANIETLKAAFITTSPHYFEFHEILEEEKKIYNAALSQARDQIARAREENLQKLIAVMPQAGQPE